MSTPNTLEAIRVIEEHAESIAAVRDRLHYLGKCLLVAGNTHLANELYELGNTLSKHVEGIEKASNSGFSHAIVAQEQGAINMLKAALAASKACQETDK